MSDAGAGVGAHSEGLCRISFSDGLPGRVCALVEGVEPTAGSWYVVQTPEGERIGQYQSFELPVFRRPRGKLPGTVIRAATAEEVRVAEDLRTLEQLALATLRDLADAKGMPLRPVAAVAPLDRDVVYLSFSAEERQDTRQLAREVSHRVRRRVELRQLGIRDQAKASGGWAACGQTLCCSTFAPRFHSISIRMAKAQNLPLNPARISGMCSRLMCCLAYEAPEGTHRKKTPAGS